MNDDQTLTAMAPRHGLTAEEISAMRREMQDALSGAQALDFFARMEHNHDTRHCWWPGQTKDARKWPEGRRLLPGQQPGEVFPWAGAADNRVPLVDEIIREHCGFARIALQRRQQRIGPRNLNPEENAQAKAALWGQVAEYYEDQCRREFRTAAAQWYDIGQEYGHGVLWIGWRTDYQVAKKEITAQDVLAVAASAAMELAAAAAAEEERELSEEERTMLLQSVAEQLETMIADEDMQKTLAGHLMQFDPEMPRSEAMRVARGLRAGGAVTYYVPDPVRECPEFRALVPFVDVLYPATTMRLRDARWICMTEWVSEPELRLRIDTEGYDPRWVDEVVEKPGQTFDLMTDAGLSQHGWLLSNGVVGGGVRAMDAAATDKRERLYQIVHRYSRMTSLGNVPALYHTVLHGKVEESAGLHMCCEAAHGEYPFVETLQECEATFLLASRGVGEISFSGQDTVKRHRDALDDTASLRTQPPMKVPLNQSGGRVIVRPGAQIPMRATAGMGVLEPFDVGARAEDSIAVQKLATETVNGYWHRGPLVEPEVKMAQRQVRVSDWLEDVRAAKVLAFQLIQEFAPEEIRAGFIAGLPVEVTVSRDDIQGQVSLEMDFDVSDLDPSLMEKRMTAVTALLQMDTQGLVQRGPLLKALAAWTLPSHWRLLVEDPQKQAKAEADDEKLAVIGLVNGIEAPYVPGQNHALRLRVLSELFGVQVDKKGNVIASVPKGPDGKVSVLQEATQKPEVLALVTNRLKFHAFQVAQQENAGVGRLGVEPVQAAGGAAA